MENIVLSVFVFCVVIVPSRGIVVNIDDNKGGKTSEALSAPSIEPRAGVKRDHLNAQHSHEHPTYHIPDYGSYYSGEHYHHYHDMGHHHHHHDIGLKQILIPLAGVALLGAAAIFASNPILLQLGVVSGRRRKRHLESRHEERLKDILTLEKFIYKLPKEQIMQQERKLLATYLTCSGANDGTNKCIERITCEMQNPKLNFSRLEKQVLKIVTDDIMQNEYISEDLKMKVKKADENGKQSGDCVQYYCSDIDDKHSSSFDFRQYS